jgi:hypothetical protein
MALEGIVSKHLDRAHRPMQALNRGQESRTPGLPPGQERPHSRSVALDGRCQSRPPTRRKQQAKKTESHADKHSEQQIIRHVHRALVPLCGCVHIRNGATQTYRHLNFSNLPCGVLPQERRGLLCPTRSTSIAPFSQIGVVHPTRRAWRVLARAFRNEVPRVRHQHVATEPRDQEASARA